MGLTVHSSAVSSETLLHSASKHCHERAQVTHEHHEYTRLRIRYLSKFPAKSSSGTAFRCPDTWPPQLRRLHHRNSALHCIPHRPSIGVGARARQVKLPSFRRLPTESSDWRICVSCPMITRGRRRRRRPRTRPARHTLTRTRPTDDRCDATGHDGRPCRCG